MKNIAVIGIGALGKRHLQSLLDLKNEYNLFGVEAEQNALVKLETEFGGKVTLYSALECLPTEIEACVIATGANNRRAVFEKLISIADVKNILFEKVLFQRKEDFYWVEKKLKEKKINAYVNCVRREWDSYKWIKEEVKDMKSFVFAVTGGEWGLCCNGIHMIDLMLYLANEVEYTLDRSLISSEIVESKRKGFYELYGILAGKSEKCKSFQISCLRGSDEPSLVLIGSDICNIVIDEGKQIAYISKRKDGWEWEKKEFLVPYQSQLTAREVKAIISGNSSLPDYETSMSVHLKYMDVLQQYFNANGWEEKDLCPIT